MSDGDTCRAERLRLSADAVAERAKQIQDACIAIGCSPEVTAAAVIADRLEDLQTELDGIYNQIGSLDSQRRR